MYILVDIHMNVLAITIASSAACFPRARGYILPTYPIYVSTSTVDQDEARGNACTALCVLFAGSYGTGIPTRASDKMKE